MHLVPVGGCHMVASDQLVCAEGLSRRTTGSQWKSPGSPSIEAGTEGGRVVTLFGLSSKSSQQMHCASAKLLVYCKVLLQAWGSYAAFKKMDNITTTLTYEDKQHIRK